MVILQVLLDDRMNTEHRRSVTFESVGVWAHESIFYDKPLGLSNKVIVVITYLLHS